LPLNHKHGFPFSILWYWKFDKIFQSISNISWIYIKNGKSWNFPIFCQEDDKIVKKKNAVLKAIFIVAEWLEKKLVSKKALLAHNINCCQLQSFQREEGLCDNQALEI
jgi:hypothetical protein